jgi:NAD(P)-dependent dehydrogenase (short-subunit alcohol dehydrogenase family)
MNQRVLVTAGASGIGLEIVRAFAAQGAKYSFAILMPKLLKI